MKSIIRYMVLVVVAGVSSLCHGDYPSAERAHLLLSPRHVSSTNLDFTACQYDRFYEDLRCDAPEDVAFEMEEFLLSSITSLVVNVSTNVVDDGTSQWLLRNRALAIARMSRGFSCFRTNSIGCLTVARYIGNVREVDFPMDRIGNFDNAMFFSTEPKAGEEWRRKRSRIRGKYELQRRINDTNRAVRMYRESLIGVCGMSIEGCRATMSSEQFTSFTNRVVMLSRATKKEREMLFGGLSNRHVDTSGRH